MVPAEWPAQAADAIVDAIGKVRDKTTKPAIKAARGVVYGTLAAIVGLVAAIVAIALAFRLYANYVGNEHLWIAYSALGLVLVLGGLVLLGKANKPISDDED
jgi:cytochrome c biogenesis protein CcdA